MRTKEAIAESMIREANSQLPGRDQSSHINAAIFRVVASEIARLEAEIEKLKNPKPSYRAQNASAKTL